MSRPDPARDLAPWEINALIEWFLYRLQPEERHLLMRDLPQVYNRIVGRDVAHVAQLPEGGLGALGPKLIKAGYRLIGPLKQDESLMIYRQRNSEVPE